MINVARDLDLRVSAQAWNYPGSSVSFSLVYGDVILFEFIHV